MGIEGKSDLCMDARKGWKDRYEGQAGSGYGCLPGPLPRVGGWESLLIRRLDNRE
jgi:hypothetical protein